MVGAALSVLVKDHSESRGGQRGHLRNRPQARCYVVDSWCTSLVAHWSRIVEFRGSSGSFFTGHTHQQKIDSPFRGRSWDLHQEGCVVLLKALCSEIGRRETNEVLAVLHRFYMYYAVHRNIKMVFNSLDCAGRRPVAYTVTSGLFISSFVSRL